LRLRSERQECVETRLGNASLAREFECTHAGERRAPGEQAMSFEAARCGQLLGARVNRLEIVRIAL
jgi:hypothetical protein